MSGRQLAYPMRHLQRVGLCLFSTHWVPHPLLCKGAGFDFRLLPRPAQPISLVIKNSGFISKL